MLTKILRWLDQLYVVCPMFTSKAPTVTAVFPTRRSHEKKCFTYSKIISLTCLQISITIFGNPNSTSDRYLEIEAEKSTISNCENLII